MVRNGFKMNKESFSSPPSFLSSRFLPFFSPGFFFFPYSLISLFHSIVLSALVLKWKSCSMEIEVEMVKWKWKWWNAKTMLLLVWRVCNWVRCAEIERVGTEFERLEIVMNACLSGAALKLKKCISFELLLSVVAELMKWGNGNEIEMDMPRPLLSLPLSVVELGMSELGVGIEIMVHWSGRELEMKMNSMLCPVMVEFNIVQWHAWSSGIEIEIEELGSYSNGWMVRLWKSG
jgi:hypothetical protein